MNILANNKKLCLALTPVEYNALHKNKIPLSKIIIEDYVVVHIDDAEIDQVRSILKWDFDDIESHEHVYIQQKSDGMNEKRAANMAIHSLLTDLESMGFTPDSILASLTLNLLEFNEKYSHLKNSPNCISEKQH